MTDNITNADGDGIHVEAGVIREESVLYPDLAGHPIVLVTAVDNSGYSPDSFVLTTENAIGLARQLLVAANDAAGHSRGELTIKSTDSDVLEAALRAHKADSEEVRA